MAEEERHAPDVKDRIKAVTETLFKNPAILADVLVPVIATYWLSEKMSASGVGFTEGILPIALLNICLVGLSQLGRFIEAANSLKNANQAGKKEFVSLDIRNGIAATVRAWRMGERQPGVVTMPVDRRRR